MNPIVSKVAPIANLVMVITAVGLSMKAIDSNSTVKSEFTGTYNYLIFIIVLLSLNIVSAVIAAGISL